MDLQRTFFASFKQVINGHASVELSPVFHRRTFFSLSLSRPANHRIEWLYPPQGVRQVALGSGYVYIILAEPDGDATPLSSCSQHNDVVEFHPKIVYKIL